MILLLVNPAAGGGRAARELPGVEAALRGHGLEVRTEHTLDLDHARTTARAAAEAGETVVTLSGDGLIGAVAGELRDVAGSTLGALPGGRGNDFCRKLGIPQELPEACAVIARGRTGLVDVGDVDGRTYVGIASLGIDTVVQDIANASKRVKGSAVYVYATLRAIARWKPARFEVRLDGGEPHAFTGYAVAVCNSGVFGGGMYLIPDARLDDGCLDVLLQHHGPKVRYLRNLPRVFKGTHLDDPLCELARAERIHVSSEPEFAIYADGDPIGRTPATITVIPKALRVILP